MSTSSGEKLQCLSYFGLPYLVVSPVGSNLRNLSTLHNYKPSPIQWYQSPFCTPTPSWGNRAQTLTFTSVTNGKTDKQTDRQKTQRFWPPRRRMKSQPHQTWHGDRGPQARSCTSKTFGVWGIVSPLGGAENLGITRPRQLKTPITP